MKTKKNFLKKLTAGILGFVMTLGVGAAGYSAAAAETHAENIVGDFSSGRNSITTPWEQSGCGSDYTSHSPYLVKLDSTGDYIQYRSTNKLAAGTYNFTIGVKMIGGATTSSITANGITSDGKSTLSSPEAVSMSISGKQNNEKTLTGSMTISTESVYGFRFTFTKGSNVGLSTITIEPPEVEKTLSSIIVSDENRSFDVDSSFVKETVTAIYDDESTADVTSSATFSIKKTSETSYTTISGSLTLDSSYNGASVKVSYTEGTEKTTDYIISVKQLLSISISGNPEKKSYYIGEAFDPTGLVVTGTYNIGDSEPITSGIEWAFDPETFTSTSETSVDVYASVGSVMVDEAYPVSDITVRESPKEFVATFATGTSNNNGTDSTDTTLKNNFGYSIDSNLTFGDISKLYGQTDQALKFGAGKNAGSFSISIPQTYQSKTIHIVDVIFTAMYYSTDESTLTVEGNDVELSNSFKEYTVNLADKNITKVNFSTLAAKRVYFSEIKITYGEPKTLTSISIDTSAHRSFDLGSDFVKETITAHYSDGSTNDVTSSATFTGYNMNQISNSQTVTVSYSDSYGSDSDSYTISVHYATVTSVTVTPNTKSLGVNSTLNLSDISVSILPNNADQSSYAWSIISKNPDNMDCSLNSTGTTFSTGSVPGTVVLRCTAGEKYDDLTVTISASALVTLSKNATSGIAKVTNDETITATVSNFSSITSYTWTSDAPTIASVSGSSNTGTIKFLYEGTANVKCEVLLVNLSGNTETVEASVAVTVTKQLASISASLIDSTKTYPENTDVPASDISVTKIYSDGQTGTATGFTVTEPRVSASDTSIKVSYTEGGITKTDDVTVTVVSAVLSSLSFTNRQTSFKEGDETTGTFAIGSGATITAKYATSFEDELLVSNGTVQENLRGTLVFKLLSKSGDNYTEVKTLVPGQDEMLRSYNGLYTRAYYTYEGSTVYSQAQQITVSAPDTIVNVTEELEESWTLVTNVNQLEADGSYVIAANGSNVAMSTTQNGNNRGETAITKTGNTITWGEDSKVQVFTLEEGTIDETWSFYDAAKEGYIYAASSSSNHLKTETTKTANSSFTITVTSTGVATVRANGSNSRNLLQYNSSSSIFSCYTSSQQAISIYKLVGGTETTPYYISESLYDAIAALPSPLTSSDWNQLSSLSSYVADSQKDTNDYKALKLGTADATGNIAEKFLAAYDSIIGKNPTLENYLRREVIGGSFTISYFEADGVTEITDSQLVRSYTFGEETSLVSASDKEGYSFEGWYSDTSLTNKVTSISISEHGNKTFYAKWVFSEESQFELDNISVNMSMAYKLAEESSTGPEWTLYNGEQEIGEGTEFVVVNKCGNNYYAANHTVSSNGLGVEQVTISSTEGITFSDNLIWTLSDLDKSDNTYKVTYKNSSGHNVYLDFNDGNVSTSEVDPELSYFVFRDIGDGKGYGLSLIDSNRALVYRDTPIFKNYATSNMGSTGYASVSYIYIKTESFKNNFKFNIKNNGLSDYIAKYQDVYDDIGMLVGYKDLSGNDQKLYFSFCPVLVDDVLTYCVYDSEGNVVDTFTPNSSGTFGIILGDAIADLRKATTVFTVCAYVIENGNEQTSNTSISYSIKDWVEEYHSIEKYTKAVQELYDIFFPANANEGE